MTEAGRDFIKARLEWSTSDLLAVFPFRHRVELEAILHPDGLTLETTLIASSEGPVPVSFGFHPYLGLPELSRANWRLELPAMRKLVLDRRGIPTGEEEPFGGFNAELGESSFDDGFALMEEGHHCQSREQITESAWICLRAIATRRSSHRRTRTISRSSR
jgi:aldose 1-epimerase